MMITRRHLLSLLAFSSAAVPITAALEMYSWWDVPASEPFKHLSSEEADQVRRIADALFPAGSTVNLSGGSAQLDRFLDRLIDQFGEIEISLIKVLLNGLEPLPFVEYGSTFSELLPKQRLNFLNAWLHNDSHLIRNAMMSIVTLMGMGYTSHPKVSPLLSTHHKCGFG